MSGERGGYYWKAIHALLLESFNTEELEQLCRFREALARAVYRFGPGDGLDVRADKLLVFCQGRGLLGELLAGIEEERPHLAGQVREIAGRVPTAPVTSGPGMLPAGSRLPLDRNALFTGREEVLAVLARGLLGEDGAAAVVTQAVHGMGGVGKTQVAVEFAYRYGCEFQGVHWVNAKEPGGIAAEIAANGERMALEPWPESMPEQVDLTLWAWSQDRPRLVVLDNLEDLAAAREWLRRLRQEGGARVLLTARRGDWPRDLGLARLPLEVFSPEESVAFLRLYLPVERGSDDELGALAERLGHLPLALELAGRYLEGVPRLTVEEYLERVAEALQHPSMRGWAAEMGNPTGHDLDLLGTFAVSWKRVRGEAARRVFLMMSYCAANVAIPCELLERATGLDGAALDGALAELAGLALVRWEGPEGPAVHPLVGEFGRAVAGTEEVGDERPLPVLAGALVELARAANERMDQEGTVGHWEPLLAHVRAVAEAAAGQGLADGASLSNSLGYHLNRIADYAGARAAYERALAIDEEAYGPEHPDVASLVNNLGMVMRALGNLAGARAALERALAIAEKAYGPEHPDVATAVNNLGSVLWALGDLTGARAAFERALAIRVKLLPAEHPDIQASRSWLAFVEEAMRSDEA